MITALTTRETADHAELLRRVLQDAQELSRRGLNSDVRLNAAEREAVTHLLSEIAALRAAGEIIAQKAENAIQQGFAHIERATQVERQRDELRKAADTAANLFKLCTEPTMFENASTLNVYAQMTEWLVRNRPLIANQGADQ